MKSSILACFVLAAAVWTTPAAADGYSFTVIAECNMFGPVPEPCAVSDFGPPDINNRGTVAFRAQRIDPDLGTPIGTGILKGDGGQLKTIATASFESGPPSDLGDPSINDAGTVAFLADPFAIEGARVMTGNGGPLTTVADTSGKFEFIEPVRPIINNRGDVSFTAALATSDPQQPFLRGVFVSRRGRIITIFDESGEFSTAAIPTLHDMNEQGEVAFFAHRIIGGNFLAGIFRGKGGPVTTILQTTDGGPILLMGPVTPSINDRGAVAFRADRFDGPNFFQSIFVGDGRQLAPVVETSGPGSPLNFMTGGTPSINNRDTVAFFADACSSDPNIGCRQGLFVGPDPDHDAVIRTGDPLFGSAVSGFGSTSPSFLPRGPAFNDRGQLAFVAHLEDGRDVLVRADPRRRR